MDADIALKELWAIEFALDQQQLRPGEHLLIHCDTMIVVNAWNNGGTRMLSVNDAMQKLFLCCLQKNWNLQIVYIPTDLNPADLPSRVITDCGIRLSRRTFHDICRFFDVRPHIDLMASLADVQAYQGQPLEYISRYPESGAFATNIFATPPPAFPYYYIFPNKNVLAPAMSRILAHYPPGRTIFVCIQYREPPICLSIIPRLRDGFARFVQTVEPDTFEVPMPDTTGYQPKRIGLRLIAVRI